MSHVIFKCPVDIIFNILSRLPTKSLIQFRCVCTSSSPLISHPTFTELHLSSPASAADHHILIYYESTDYLHEFYSLCSPATFQETLKLQFPYEHLHGFYRIVGSDKGLICLFYTNFYSNLGSLTLWNPSIQKIKNIPNPNDSLGEISHFVMGFGFVSRTFGFKVVEIAYHLDNFKVNNTVLVYSLSTNSWKKMENMCAPCDLPMGWSSNIFVNGFVNWLAYKRMSSGFSLVMIMVFDLDNERFHVLELPHDIVPGYGQVNIGSYGELTSSSLSLCAHYFDHHGDRWDVWEMGDYGFMDSWKKVCVVSHPVMSMSISPLLMRNNHEVLIVMNDGRLMLFDAVKNEMHDLETRGLPHTFRAISYTASLALING